MHLRLFHRACSLPPCPWCKTGPGLALLVLMLTALTMPARATVITDALGRQVTVETPVQHMVATNSDALEVLRSLNAQDRVVGVYAEILREPLFWGRHLTGLPKTGSWNTPNLEAIADLDPDLVLTYGRNPSQDFDRKMAALGIPVLRLDFYKPATLESEVRKLGQLLGEDEAAQAFCDWHRGHMALIRERVAAMPRPPRVYIESYSELATAGPRSGAHEMCLLAGGLNLAAGASVPYPRVTPEWVVARNPEIIVKAASWGNGYQATDAGLFNDLRDAIMGRPVWSAIPAVKNGRVHVMDSAIWTGPRVLIGIAWMARWFYPDHFTDVDPDAWHADYLRRFQGVNCQGTWVSEPVRVIP